MYYKDTSKNKFANKGELGPGALGGQRKSLLVKNSHDGDNDQASAYQSYVVNLKKLNIQTISNVLSDRNLTAEYLESLNKNNGNDDEDDSSDGGVSSLISDDSYGVVPLLPDEYDIFSDEEVEQTPDP